MTALNEDTPDEMKYILSVMGRLISKDFDQTGATVY
jgi:hypothetical protein